jgi:lysyl-tRNA synthetase class 2
MNKRKVESMSPDILNQWEPSISRNYLKVRATYLQKVRSFFYARDVLEVETPLLYEYPVTDPYLDAFEVQTQNGIRYLQTSPEYAMKRLLANDSGSIFQICKAFRDDPEGCHHHYEFTMLEWYRVGFNDKQLMDEIALLIQDIKPKIQATYLSYQSLFQQYLGINPHTIDHEGLKGITFKYIGKIEGLPNPSKEDCLNLLLTHKLEVELAKMELVFIYDYPESQAALAKVEINRDGIKVAKRFEAYYKGIELANGYNELTDSEIQRERFEKDLQIRKVENKKDVPVDLKLLAALNYGMPECAGVALGLDRLIMVLECCEDIKEVMYG